MSGSNASGLATKPPDRRRLVAVVYADMVGYSRLIGMDDTGTIQRLRSLRGSLIDPAIEAHGGMIVQTGGDSLLIVFDSIDGAIQCAAKVQQEVPIIDGDQPSDRAIRFRIGVNIGDAIADGTDLHGDAVNIAARLQAECPTGGICVSRSVRDHMQGRPDFAFEELGALNLKNITHPVDAYVVRFDAVRPIERLIAAESLPLPDKPSVAILPFANLSADLDQDYFSEGIADDIITELSRTQSLFVIARNSSFTYCGQAVNVKQVARELGVRYVVEGSVRRAGNRIRVNAQLIDALAGNPIWAERYDRQLADLFDVQDEITAAVATAIQPAIEDAEIRRILRKPTESLRAWELYQRALWHFSKFTDADNERTVEFAQRAIDQDITLVPAYLIMCQAYYESGQAFTARSFEAGVELAETWAVKVEQIDPNDAEVQAIMGSVAQLQGRLDDAWERASLGLMLNPHSQRINTLRASLMIFSGRSTEGRNILLDLIRLNPRDPRIPHRLNQILVSYYYERNYLETVAMARRIMARFPTYALPYRWLAAALGQLGRREEASQTLAKALALAPQTFDLFVKQRLPWHPVEGYDHMIDGLRKAGWRG
jgi:adenylate cyclase